jgi:dolichol-phosphate mannosyltransferase
MTVSVVIPVFNEEGNVLPLAEELAAVALTLPGCEVVFVDDGSTDATWARIREAASKFPAVRGVRGTVNRGQTAAMLLGLKECRGDRVVTMDGDLQNNPADIPRVLAGLDTHDAVCGYRAQRRDSWSRRAASRIGNAVRNAIAHDGLRDTGCSLKAFRRACIADLPPLSGAHRFMGAYFTLHGRSILELPVDHRHRRHGASKYTNLKRLPRTVFDLIGFVWYRRRLVRDCPVETT